MSDHKHYDHDRNFDAATTKVSLMFSRPVEEALARWLNSMADSSATQAQVDLMTTQVKELTRTLRKSNSGLRKAVEKES